MNAAEAFVRTFIKYCIEIYFIYPGTLVMCFVVALDYSDGMKCVLGIKVALLI